MILSYLLFNMLLTKSMATSYLQIMRESRTTKAKDMYSLQALPSQPPETHRGPTTCILGGLFTGLPSPHHHRHPFPSLPGFRFVVSNPGPYLPVSSCGSVRTETLRNTQHAMPSRTCYEKGKLSPRECFVDPIQHRKASGSKSSDLLRNPQHTTAKLPNGGYYITTRHLGTRWV